MKPLPLLALTAALLLAGCNTTNSTPRVASSDTGTPSRAIYALHHRTLPTFTFQSNGAFFADMMAGRDDVLRQAVTDLVGADYAKALIFTPHASGRGLLISFPEPQGMTECYHVAVWKQADGKFRYFTLEKTLDFGGHGMKTAFCEWTEDGAHVNGGFRTYTDLARFQAEIEAILRTPDGTLTAEAITR